METVEANVKTVVGPVYDRFHDVPFEFLKFVDLKVRVQMKLFICFLIFDKWNPSVNLNRRLTNLSRNWKGTCLRW